MDLDSTSPGREIRNEHVAAEVELRLIENQPPTRTAASVIERITELSSEHARCAAVRNRRSRRRIELAVEYLGDEVIGDLTKVVVGGVFLQRLHEWSLAPRAFGESTANLREAK